MDLKGAGSKRLAAAQRLSRKGTYALALSTFVQHLAQHYNVIGLERDLLDDEAWQDDDGWRDTEQARLRDLAPVKSKGHTATLLGELGTGWEALLTVAVDLGALTRAEAVDYWRRAWADLYRAAERQSDALLLSGPATRMLDYLGAALAAGRCHLAGAKGGPPDGDDSARWGWQATPETTSMGIPTGELTWRPRGDRIGYLTADVVWLLALPALSMAKRLAVEGGEDLNVSEASVTDRLIIDKYLVGTDDPDHKRTRVPYAITPGRPRSWPILRYRLTIWSFEVPGQSGQSGQWASEPGDSPEIIAPDLHFYTGPVSPDDWPGNRANPDDWSGYRANRNTPSDLGEYAQNSPVGPIGPIGPVLNDVNVIAAPDPYEAGPLPAYFEWIAGQIDAAEAEGEPVDTLPPYPSPEELRAIARDTPGKELREALYARADVAEMLADPDRVRFPELPVIVEDPETTAALDARWEGREAERAAEVITAAFPAPATAAVVTAERPGALPVPSRIREPVKASRARQGAPSAKPGASALDVPADMAVLDAEGLAFTDGRAVAGLPSSAAALAILTLDGGADRVAILPGAVEALGWPAQLTGEPYTAPALVTPWAETRDGRRCTPARDKGEPGTVWRTVRIVSEGRGPSVVAMVPSWDDFGALSECRDRKSALAFLRQFHQTVGYPWRGLVAETTGGLIRATHPIEHGGAQVYRGDDMPAPATNDLEAVSNYCRPWTTAELSAGYLHAFDQRAQFLAPLGSLSLGRGDVIHHPEGLAYRKGTPALYRLAEALPADLGDGLPVPWGPGPWYMGETVERAAELLTPPPVVEAYTWPEKGRYLEGFCKRLRAAIKALDGSTAPGAREALAAVKACYRIQVGRLGAAHLAETKAAMYRPCWRLAVIAKSRCNLDRRLRPLDVRPVRVATDAAYFVTDEPDPLTFGAVLGLPMTPDLGHFKPAGTVKLSPKLAAELSALAGTPGRFDRRLKRELEK
jgi:hypothetical protein